MCSNDITQPARTTRRRLLLGILGGLASSSPEPLIGIDHIPFVVADLDAAAETYRRLGFVIKPGRFHADGIRNEHVKFEDGAGLELITAPTATDAVTAHYRDLLMQGEGPAFVGFHTSSQGQLTDALTRGGVGFGIDDGQVLPTHPAL